MVSWPSNFSHFVTGTYEQSTKGYGIIGRQINLGVGLPAGPVPVNAAGGFSNTVILHDFYKK